ncbi:hypothetical protein ACFQ51_11005 [Streptomyces kaempferi]
MSHTLLARADTVTASRPARGRVRRRPGPWRDAEDAEDAEDTEDTEDGTARPGTPRTPGTPGRDGEAGAGRWPGTGPGSRTVPRTRYPRDAGPPA